MLNLDSSNVECLDEAKIVKSEETGEDFVLIDENYSVAKTVNINFFIYFLFIIKVFISESPNFPCKL